MTDYDNYDFWNPGEEEMYKKMTNEERFLAAVGHIGCMIVAIIIVMILCAICTGCTTTQYIPVIEHHTDTLIQTKVQKDSIYVHDSVTVSQKGDTVWVDRWHTKWVNHLEHDTTYVSKTDTVPVPYTVETIKEVEKPLAWWQKTLMWLGVAMIGIIAVRIWRTK